MYRSGSLDVEATYRKIRFLNGEEAEELKLKLSEVLFELLKFNVIGYVEDIEKITLLLELGASVEARNKKGSTPLIIAAENGRLKLMELLLQKGADPNALNYCGNTPLFLAIRWRQPLDVLHSLLNNGAALLINYRNKEGFTALSIAREYHPTAKGLLLQFGAV